MSFIDDVFELRLEDIGEGDEVTFVGDLCVASRPSRARGRDRFTCRRRCGGVSEKRFFAPKKISGNLVLKKKFRDLWFVNRQNVRDYDWFLVSTSVID